jgi:hypothetical protein
VLAAGFIRRYPAMSNRARAKKMLALSRASMYGVVTVNDSLPDAECASTGRRRDVGGGSAERKTGREGRR